MKQQPLLSFNNPNRKKYLWIGVLVIVAISIFYYSIFERTRILEQRLEELQTLSAELQATIDEILRQKEVDGLE